MLQAGNHISFDRDYSRERIEPPKINWVAVIVAVLVVLGLVKVIWF